MTRPRRGTSEAFIKGLGAGEVCQRSPSSTSIPTSPQHGIPTSVYSNSACVLPYSIVSASGGSEIIGRARGRRTISARIGDLVSSTRRSREAKSKEYVQG
jgi:hypothetical protein